MMEQESQKKNEWCVIKGSVQGASHQQNNMPNQDAVHVSQPDPPNAPVILAIADGHGSKENFRSHYGSQFAVEVAAETLATFAQQHASLPDKEQIKQYAQALPAKIVAQWTARVEAHLDSDPFYNKKEWLFFGKGKSLPRGMADAMLAYGSTLLAVVMTKKFFVCLQIGDGDIVFVRGNGQVLKPMGEDPRLLANQTTSLCSPTAPQDFRSKIYFLENTPPALILLSTDGYANSFTTPKDFLQVGSDILGMLRKEGVDKVAQDVEGWLQAATNKGSGDDITLGFLCHLPSLYPPFPDPYVEPPVQITNEPSLKKERDVADPTQLPARSMDEQAQPNDKTQLVPSKPSFVDRPSSEKKEKKLRVSQSQNADYHSIKEALAHAEAGTTIFVAPGEYRESLQIVENVDLIAEGATEQVVLTGETPCVSITAQNALLQGFVFRPSAGQSAAVEISAGSVTIAKCEVVNAAGIGIRVRGASLVIRNSLIQKTSGAGIIFIASSTGNLERCTVQQNTGIGVGVSTSQVLMNGCQISENRMNGLQAQRRSMITIEGGRIERNKQSGLFIVESDIKIKQGHVDGNGATDIMIKDHSSIDLEECNVKSNESINMKVVQESQLNVRGGSFQGKGEHCAVYVSEQSRGKMERCTIESKGVDVYAFGKVILTLEKCKLISDTGIVKAEQESRITLISCTAVNTKSRFCDQTSEIIVNRQISSQFK